MNVTRPDSPDFGMVQTIHRNHDGWVTFHRKDASGNFVNLASVRTQDLDGVLPGMEPVLETDSYFSINAFFRPGWGNSHHLPAGVTLPNAYREGKGLRWLTCAFADLDGHHHGLTVGTVLGKVFDAQAAGAIPAVSLFQFSGRGLWCYWILKDAENGGPVRAWPERVPLYGAVQRAIGERLTAAAADPGARDAVRVTRIPGSINSKVATRVTYSVQADADGNPFVYTLDDLADFLNVRTKPMNGEVLCIDAVMSERGRRGAAGRWRKDLHRFRALWELRGTWRVGLRAKAVFIYGAILRALRGTEKLSAAAVLDELTRLWSDFEQPAGDVFRYDELLKVAAASIGRPLQHQTISDYLDVTTDEAAIVGWPPAAQAAAQELRLPNVKGATRAETQQLRRAALEALIAARNGTVPTLREMVDHLCSIGIDAAPATVRADLKSCGVLNPRRHRVRSARRRDPKLFDG